MRYLSIDVETTGLDPLKHQTIELAIIDSLTKSTFHCYISHHRYEVEPYCAMLHQPIWKALNDAVGYQGAGIGPATKPTQSVIPIYKITQLEDHLLDWQASINHSGKFLGAGKNFGSFDKRFLDQLPIPFKFYGRTLDPGSMWAKADDVVPPDLTECVKRAGVQPRELHNALADAWMAHDCIEAFFKKGNVNAVA